jgi:uncharacterized protein (DUF2147 family)
MRLILGIVLGMAVWAEAAFSTDSPAGVWRMTSGKVTVRISNCGGTGVCATIVGLAQPFDKRGNPKVDRENPNPALRNRRIIGLQVANQMKMVATNRWNGRIYNADDGNTYRAEAVLSGNSLSITGCWGPICKKNRFVRVR